MQDLILRVVNNGVTTDLDIDSSIPLRLDISKIENQELGKVFGIGSQIFQLPGTKTNNKFFNNGYDIAASDIPGLYNPIDAYVLLNGEIILFGSLRLEEIITSEDGYVDYKVQISDRAIQFSDALKDKFIADADWSSYNHILSSASISSSWAGDLVGGAIFYPIADYGRDDTVPFPTFPRLAITASSGGVMNIFTPLASRQLLPAIRLKDTIDVIFDQVGYRYTSSFIESEDFSNLFLLTKPNDTFGVIVDPSASATFSAVGNGFNQVVTLGSIAEVSASSEISDPQNAYSTALSEFTAQQTGEHTLQGSISFINPNGTTGLNDFVRIDLELRAGASSSYTVVDTVFDTYSSFIDGPDGIGPFTLSVNGTQAMTAGLDKAWLVVTYTQVAGAGTPGSLTLLPSTGRTFKCIEAPTQYEGATIEMNQQFNNQLKSEDIFKGLIQQFNLIITPDLEDQQILIIEPFDEWQKAGEVKDWTEKYDISKRIGIKGTISELPKTVILTNAEDNDRFSVLTKEQEPYRQYGALELIASSTNAQGDTTIGDFFAPIILSAPITLEEGFPLDITNTLVFPHLYKYDNNKQVTYAFKPRIGYKVKNLIPSGSGIIIGNPGTGNNIYFTSSYYTLSNLSAIPPVTGVTKDLHFNTDYANYNQIPNFDSGISNFTTYWKTYYDSLYWDEAKKITIDLYFEPQEYKDINLNDKIVIKNQYYRINKITGFNLKEPDIATVELIRLYPEYI